ncbi:hypothetical protein, partial [Bacillus velezensis]|uniref:hypothetical protein n=1 Tax=Bacillus velezensis TaxID=492670 RepID=UPI0021B5E9B3
TVHILIPTHTLLSKHVLYKHLAFLIIHQHQRFPLTHNEKIKHIKPNLHLLTLTPTPIPPTLHISILALRDLSLIETPPENRFPVHTYVVE